MKNPYRTLSKVAEIPTDSNPYNKIYTETFITDNLIVDVRFIFDYKEYRDGLIFFNNIVENRFKTYPTDSVAEIKLEQYESIEYAKQTKPLIKSGSDLYYTFREINHKTVRILCKDDSEYYDVLWDKIIHFHPRKVEKINLTLSWKFYK